MDDQDLTALVGSRICHDLISPLGAIGNGLELLQMSGGPDSPEIALISDSLESATARIRFFRIAFGDACPGQIISGTEVDQALRFAFSGTHLSLQFDAQDMERQTVRVLFLALQCLETAMPYGGRITATTTNQEVSLTGTSDRFAREDAIWDYLTGVAPRYALRPAQVQFALLRDHARAAGRCIRLSATDTTLSLTL